MYETETELSAKKPKHNETDSALENTLMVQTALSDVAIAIASDSLQQRTNLRRLMSLSGLNVVLSEPLTRLFLRKLESTEADVLLLDLHDEFDHDDDLLHEVLDKVEIPIIFNDVTALTLNESAADSKWHFSLMQKIADLRGIDDWQSAEFDQPVLAEEVSGNKEAKLRPDQNLATRVWVLGASLGGPEALKRFLKALPKDVQAGFIITQHLGANFVSKLAEQLNRYTKLNVMPPVDGHVFLEGDVIITPVGERLKINPIGNIELERLTVNTTYTPSIDLTISDIADRYGDKAGAIIFSGMGDDGKLGCEKLHEKGGQVWLQSSESCVISSMPDNVKKTCDVQFVGNTEQLARKLTEHLQTIEVV